MVQTEESSQHLRPLCQMLLTLQRFPLVLIVHLSYVTQSTTTRKPAYVIIYSVSRKEHNRLRRYFPTKGPGSLTSTFLRLGPQMLPWSKSQVQPLSFP